MKMVFTADWSAGAYNELAEAVLEKAAHYDGWRQFISPALMAVLELHGTELEIDHNYRCEEARVHLPATTSEEKARSLIQILRRPGIDAPYSFLRNSLTDPRAWADLPLRQFVPVDERVEPIVRFAIHQHWQVPLAHFSFGRKQERHQKFETLVFNHPQLEAYNLRDGQVVVQLPYDPQIPIGERRENLFLAAERRTAEWNFSITERWVTRRLNNEPDPVDDVPW